MEETHVLTVVKKYLPQNRELKNAIQSLTAAGITKHMFYKHSFDNGKNKVSLKHFNNTVH